MEDLNSCMLALSAASGEERAAAAEQLAKNPSECQAAAVPLVRATADEDESVREWATAALEEMGPPAVDDCQALTQILAQDAADAAYWAATLLGRLESSAAAATPALATAIEKHSAPNVRHRAAWALGQIGSAAKSARPQLEAAAKSSDARLARLAAKALESVGS